MSNHKVTAWGFTLAYCALMAGLAILTMPHTDGWRVEVGHLSAFALPSDRNGDGALRPFPPGRFFNLLSS